MSSIFDMPSWEGVEVRQGDLKIEVQPIHEFQYLKLSDSLIQGCKRTGFCRPYEIQQYVLPLLSEKRRSNVIVQAPNGTGKTVSALFAALSLVTLPGEIKSQAVLLYPTREHAKKALHIAENMTRFCSKITFHLAVKDQKRNQGIITENIIIGTPRKLEVLCSENRLKLENIKLIVLDEADQLLLNRGHQAHVSRFFSFLECQTAVVPMYQIIMLYSSHENIEKSVEKHVKYPVFMCFPFPCTEICLANVNAYFVICSSFREKSIALKQLFEVPIIHNKQCIIICEKKGDGEDVSTNLKESGFSAVFLHGKLKSEQKEHILNDFMKGMIQILVSTPSSVSSIANNPPHQLRTVVNYDILIAGKKLDHGLYSKRLSVLSTEVKGLAINMVDEIWAKYIAGENGQELPLINYSDLKTVLMNDLKV